MTADKVLKEIQDAGGTVLKLATAQTQRAPPRQGQ